MKKQHVAGTIVVLVLALIWYVFFDHPSAVQQPASTPPTSSTVAAPDTNQPADVESHWGKRVKTAGCQVNGPFPDPECSPGAIFPNVTRDDICKSGYARTVRDVPDSEKNDVYEEYGIKTHTTGQYEVDHFISLELGGSNDISNLFPEAASPKPGFHEKDKVENYLHDQVCSGAMTLKQAQVSISTNWLAVYQSMPK